MSSARLVTKPFVAVTIAAAAFFTYVGVFVPLLPVFIEDELGGGELGVGLSIATFALAAILVRPVIGRSIERFGRRRLMWFGAAVAGTAGAMCALVTTLPQLLALRAVAGVGEAALFVAAATTVADLAPPQRRAEAASYFSVAVFVGIGIGPVIGEALLDGDRYGRAFVVAGLFAALAGVLASAVPARILTELDGGEDVAPVAAAARRRWHRVVHPVAVGPGLVLASGMAAFSAFSAFLPEHAREVGLAGSGGLFATYSAVSLVIRLAGARLPERLGPRRSVTIAMCTVSVALLLLAAVASVWALWVAAAVVGVGMSFQYPSLMALTVDRTPERERARALSSFTMFFEVGTVAGGLVLGTVAELVSKRAAFASAVLAAAVGLWLMRHVVVPRPQADHPCPIPADVSAAYVPVAGD